MDKTDDTVFGTLTEYGQQSYYEEHKVLWLLTPEKTFRLLPIAGFVTPGGFRKLHLL